MNCTLLANIYSFVIQNLAQHVHRTSWHYGNDLQNEIYGRGEKQKAVWSVVIGFWGGQEKRESVVCCRFPW